MRIKHIEEVTKKKYLEKKRKKERDIHESQRKRQELSEKRARETI